MIQETLQLENMSGLIIFISLSVSLVILSHNFSIEVLTISKDNKNK